jgi:hypothetical protein
LGDNGSRQLQGDGPDVQRFVELLHDQKKRLAYRKWIEMAVELVRQFKLPGAVTAAPSPRSRQKLGTIQLG